MIKTIEISIGNQKYVIKGDDEGEHLAEVAEMVRRKVDGFKKKSPTINLQKAAMLAAFEFANEVISQKKKNQEYRSSVLLRATEILEKVEKQLSRSTH